MIFISFTCIKTVPNNNVFKCLEDEWQPECKITAKVTKANPRFVINTTLSKDAVKWFWFLDPSFVPILTSDICETFPNLLSFNAKFVSIEEIHADAFEKCSDLQYLDLFSNPIKKLPERTFAGLSKLNQLYLTGAVLPETSEGLFRDMAPLKMLWLMSNKIVSLPAKVFEGLVNLEKIFLYSNELKDFKVGEALKNLKNLKEILDFTGG